LPSVEDYIRSATAAKLLALEAADKEERDILLRIAAQWERLAQYKAKKEGHSER
jgi:hypothetical protein